MNRKTLIIGALAIAGALSAGIAQARSDVQWSVTIGAPIGVPIYSQPYPGYNQPYPVYTQPYPDYRPVPIVRYRGYQSSAYGDRDHDGIPNRYDRVYNPRWDRDGDGIPNRYERQPRNGHDRDRDGIPDWRDHNDGRGGRR
ncbi:MAG: hypothetical protein V4792_17555 [Pseudomonadota bacterium]